MANPIPIDPRQVYELASIGATNRDIALVLGISLDTLWRRFQTELEKGRANSRTQLRMLMWNSAKNGSYAMQIFLAKNWLHYKDATPDNAATIEDGANRIVESLQGKSHSELLEQYMRIRNEAREVKELESGESDNSSKQDL